MSQEKTVQVLSKVLQAVGLDIREYYDRDVTDTVRDLITKFNTPIIEIGELPESYLPKLESLLAAIVRHNEQRQTKD